MKIYLADRQKLRFYSLPEQIEGNYTISYNPSINIEEIITFSAVNNKWTITSNYNMIVYKDATQILEDTMEINNEYQIQFTELPYKIMLYCCENSFEYYDYEIGNRDNITISRNGQYDILYDNNGIGLPHYKIYRYNNSWILEDNGYEESYVYVNNYRTRKTILNIGDAIYTCGFKLIWMGLFIRINNPGKKISTRLSPFKGFAEFNSENKYTPVKENEKGIVLYNDNQTFFHTPRIKSNISKKTIKIEDPPAKVITERDPAIFTYGATIIIGFSSSLTGFIAITNILSGKSTILGSLVELSMCAAMLIGSILLPITQDKYHIRKEKKKEKKRQKKYGAYLEKKRSEIKAALDKETSILFQNDLSTDEMLKAISNLTTDVWSREITDDDFLSFRVGLGNKKSQIELDASVKEFSMDNDNLKQEREDIINTPLLLTNVPITTSLIENRIMSLIINYNYSNRQYYINNIMLQLITYYSGVDLKILILTTEDNERYWNYFKYLPHCCSDDKLTRLFASNEEETKQLCSYLEQVYQERVILSSSGSDNGKKMSFDDYDAYKNFNQYYLVITDNYLLVKKYGVINKIIESEKNYGFSLLTIESTMQNVPSKCDKFIQINEGECYLLSKDVYEENKVTFTPEFLYVNIDDYARIISNIPISVTNQAANLPTSISFLEMYKVGNIDQLNIFNRWNTNDPTISLHTPIGVHENGTQFEIDLHEKYHGPHGLIAGSTGSGKSEFIITFILSMAVNYHPYEVQFVLIDYKGGGLAGAFENRETGVKIPHLVGTITNLDKSSMNRTLISIQSELQRRQKLFNAARDSLGESTIDIYKYQKFYREGKLKEPCSHLFIIADEFAELKDQQPDFMDNLVSAARIGRSLGVHLILATQKPTGVVDDQIWSNTKFRICLKVQTAEDSNEMLKRPEAASIKETGRFYLQVGFDELFELGQSGWAGARYFPSDKIIKTINDSIDFINNSGSILRKINDDTDKKEALNKQEDLGDQLTNIVKTLYGIAIDKDIKFNQLWLDNVPPTIYLGNLSEKYPRPVKQYVIDTLIGEYDDPANQKQGPVYLNFTTEGNALISGVYGSGKTTLVSTILFSALTNHSTDELNVYIVDLLAETLKIFKGAPQVGDFISLSETDKLKKLFHFLNKEVERRKKYFSNKGGSFIHAIEHGETKFPNILIVINGMDVFRDEFDDLYDDFLIPLTRDCNRFGINFVITSTGSLSSTLENNFPRRIALKFLDPSEYTYIFNETNGIIPGSNPGRGLIELDSVYEFQTALLYKLNETDNIIANVCEQLSKVTRKAPSIPKMPKIVTVNDVKNDISTLDSVPIGIEIASNCTYTYDFTNFINFITYQNENVITSFETALLNVLRNIQNSKVFVLDAIGTIPQIEGINLYNSNFKKITKGLYQNITQKKSNDPNSEKIIFVISNYQKIEEHLQKLREEDETVKTIDDLIVESKNTANFKFILINNDSLRSIDNKEWSDYADLKNGILLAMSADNQYLLDCDESYDSTKMSKDTACVIKDTKKINIKYIRNINL